MSPHGRKMMVDNRFGFFCGEYIVNPAVVSHVFPQSVDLDHISTRYGYAGSCTHRIEP